MCLTNLQFMTAGPGPLSLPRIQGAPLADHYALYMQYLRQFIHT